MGESAVCELLDRVLATARVFRVGHNLVFGEVELFDEEGKMAVQATTTYALFT
jgi:acyl-coenzyme A thioesterase PaaI-like protein